MISDSKSLASNNKPQTPVYLNVYNFWSCFNQTCEPLGIGVYHTGIQIFEDQYMFFGFDGDQTGVGYIQPYTAAYQFKQQIFLGYINLNFFQLDQKILDPLRLQFSGNKYDLLANNCNHFSKRLAKQLQVQQKFPPKVFRITNCCNLFRCCLPQCLLNGRLDWLNKSTQSQESDYYQLQDIVSEQQDIKVIKQKSQTINTPKHLQELHQSYSSRQQSRIKYGQPHLHELPKNTTLRKGIWPHTQNAHQRLSVSHNAQASFQELQIQHMHQKNNTPQKKSVYPSEDLSLYLFQNQRNSKRQHQKEPINKFNK